jgi:U3 small nucleolar RNA-associated protein 18
LLCFFSSPIVSNFPIYSASFIGSSGNVVVTGRRPFFYIYDTIADKVLHIPKLYGRDEKSWERCVASPYDDTTIALLGNDGYVILYDTKRQTCRTTQPIKLNGSVRTVSFTNNGLELLASGSDGDIYRYDIRSSTSKCIERFSNMDGTITSNMACSRRTFAVGAESGVVNIYAENEHQQPQISSSSSPSLLRGFSSTTTPRTPLKSIMNLKTSVDAMRYNDDGQILAISSRREKDTMKLIHIPTRTVYSNWPTSHTPLGYVWSLDFSPQSKFLAIGNDQGKCLLYKLMHYD